MYNIFMKIKRKLYYYKYKSKYRNINVLISGFVRFNEKTFFEGDSKVNNETNIENSSIGKGTYIADKCKLFNCSIGRFSSIGSNVSIIVGAHPTDGYVSTHPSFYSLDKQSGFTFVKANSYEEIKYADRNSKKLVCIGNDVWIGNNVSIMQGVKIGDGAVIGANSLVTKDVEPYSINVGLPCKKIKNRFDKDQREFLQKFKWWNKDFEWLKNNCDLMQDIEKLYAKYNDKEC